MDEMEVEYLVEHPIRRTDGSAVPDRFDTIAVTAAALNIPEDDSGRRRRARFTNPPHARPGDVAPRPASPVAAPRPCSPDYMPVTPP